MPKTAWKEIEIWSEKLNRQNEAATELFIKWINFCIENKLIDMRHVLSILSYGIHEYDYWNKIHDFALENEKIINN